MEMNTEQQRKLGLKFNLKIWFEDCRAGESGCKGGEAHRQNEGEGEMQIERFMNLL